MVIEQDHTTEVINPTHKRTRLSKVGATAAFAAVPIDVAASDRTFLWAQSTFSGIAERHRMSHTAEWWFVHGATSFTIGAQALGLLGLVTLSEGARDALKGFNSYVAAKQANMKGARRVVSKVINSPISFLEFVGDKFEKVGQKFENRPSWIARQLGKTVVDVARGNTMSMTGQGMYENSLRENPIGFGRKNRICWTFAGSWTAMNVSVSESYHALENTYVRALTGVEYPGVDFHGAVGVLGRGAAEITSVYPVGVGTAFWGAVAAASLIAGSRAVDYNDANPTATVDLQELPQTAPFNPAA